MAQFDLLLTQNIHATGVEFSEKYVNIAKGGILSALADGTPAVLPAGSNGYMLVRDDLADTGLKWQAIPSHHTQNTDTGTTSTTFHIDSDATGPKLKNNGGNLEVRNSADSAFANIQAGNATFSKVTVTAAPTAGSDLTNKTYVDGLLSANDAMVYKGTLGTGGTVTALPTTYSAGWTYRVITAGTYAGVVCEVGDLLTAIVDRAGTGNLNSDWTAVQTNIDGAVTGPAEAISDESIAVWNSNNRSIKSSGVLITSLATKNDLNSYVLKSTFDANTILKADSDNTPVALAVPNSTIIGRAATGTIDALTAAEVRTILNVADGANNYVHFNGGGGSRSGLSGATVISGITVNTEGHVTATATRNMSWSDIGAKQDWVAAPATKISTGVQGQFAYDDNFFYICTATNIWKRVPIATNW